jgi:GT2 family glycosyltransferase
VGLAVILLNWRHEAQTLRCAAAVAGWRALSPQLIVVDNESTEASRKALFTALSTDTIICSAINRGYGGGNNLGIKRALGLGCKYVLLLNTDAEISSLSVNQLLARLESDSQLSVVGPFIRSASGGVTRCLIGGRDIACHLTTRTAVSVEEIKTFPHYPLREVDYVSGTVFLARSSVFKEIGLLDEHFFFSGEIADFCKRARAKGYRSCVDLKAEARHITSQTAERLRETLYVYYDLRNRFLYIQKHHVRMRLIYCSYWTIIGCVRFGLAACRLKRAKARAIALALTHAYQGRYGNQNGAFPCSSVH